MLPTSENSVRKLSEKPRTRPLRSHTGDRNRHLSVRLALRIELNTGSERCSLPFSDSFREKFAQQDHSPGPMRKGVRPGLCRYRLFFEREHNGAASEDALAALV